MPDVNRLKGIDQLKSCLREKEQLLDGSNGCGRPFYGACSGLVGLILTVESVRLLLGGISLFAMGEMLVGLAFLYGAYALLVLTGRNLVAVSDQRIIQLKQGVLKARISEVPLSEIDKATLFKHTVMFGNKHAGEIRIVLRNGKSVVLPFLANAEYVLETIGEVLHPDEEEPMAWIREEAEKLEANP